MFTLSTNDYLAVGYLGGGEPLPSGAKTGIVVRSKRRKSDYHHGDLRAAVITEALAILNTEGLEALTLREVARRVGVTQAAPYRHFRDRRQLIGAVAAEGFTELRAAMLKGAQAGGRAGMKGVALSYLEFGRRNRALYGLMFGSEIGAANDLPELAEAGRQALGVVSSAIEAQQAAGTITPGRADLLAVSLWAALHGLTDLVLSGQTTSLAPAEKIAESMLRVMMYGLAPR